MDTPAPGLIDLAWALCLSRYAGSERVVESEAPTLAKKILDSHVYKGCPLIRRRLANELRRLVIHCLPLALALGLHGDARKHELNPHWLGALACR